MQKHVKRYILGLLSVVFLCILSYSSLLTLPVSCKDENRILNIPRHSTADSVAKVLDEKGCINTFMFKLAIYTTFNQSRIKPGLYNIDDSSTLGELIKLITSSSMNTKKITIIEGWNIYDIADNLSRQLNINKDKFINLCLDQEYIQSLNIPFNIQSLEGFLFPDTYTFLSNYTENDIIETFIQHFMNIYDSHIKTKLSSSHLEFIDVLILSSIIQGEAMLTEEMPTISSVYHNRLNRKMKLEADPTILYYMTPEDLLLFKDKPGSSESSKVFNKYKRIDSRHNTYYHQGLPATPINNPGLKAIYAALFPENTDKKYLYFVADGTGGHIFSKTLREHNRAIRKIRRGY